MRDTKIDIAKGLCMVSIFLLHTEIYYTGEEIVPYAYHVDNSLLAFVFVSGYLFVKQSYDNFNLQRKVISILKGITLPYFIFTSAIAFPKALVRDDTTLLEAFKAVITGHASWFLAALMLAEMLFALIIFIASKRKNSIFFIFVCCSLPYLLVACCYHFIHNDLLHDINIWCWQNALIMLFFLFAGLTCKQRQLIPRLQQPKVLFILALVILAVKWMVTHENMTLTMEPINVSSFTLLLVDGLAGAMLIVGGCRHLPDNALLQFIGKHSLIYYFICGATPMAVCLALKKIGFSYTGHYWQVIVTFILVLLAATIITYGITKIKGKYLD
ncbi:MAG: acyltransferase [Prevotella sp.]|nr:acyltransferase [Prevotella sp.]